MFSGLATSQIAVSGKFLTNNSESWDDYYASSNALSSGIELGLGYWFRFTDVRIEFIPEISYTKFNSDFADASALNGQLNVLIYAIDFYSDCGTCPTFSKDGSTLKKGFHWILAPGITKLSGSSVGTETFPDYTTWRMAIGAGLDFGFSNVFTLTPFITYNMGSKTDYVVTNVESRFSQLHLGLRTVIRLDKNKW